MSRPVYQSDVAIRRSCLPLILCGALLFLAACDGFEWNLYDPELTDHYVTADEDSVAVEDDAAVELPPRPRIAVAEPVDATERLIQQEQSMPWVELSFEPPALDEHADFVQEAIEEGSRPQLTEEELAALRENAAAILDTLPRIPQEFGMSQADQDRFVESLSEEQLAAYDDPSLADDNDAGQQAGQQFSLDMVIDETRSTHGRDFYDMFYNKFDAPDGAMNYTIYVREQPGRGQGSVVEVRVNDEIAFRTQLQPRYEVIEQAAEQAVSFTQRFMQHTDVSRAIY